MTAMLWTLFVLLVLCGVSEAAFCAKGGRYKSAEMSAVDSVLNLLLAGWILWYLAK